MFVTVRHKWAWGFGKWEIQSREYSSLEAAKEELCHGVMGCDEHCRGVEIKRVKYLPMAWLEEQIDNHKRAAIYHDGMRSRFQRMLEKQRGRRDDGTF